MEDVDLPQAQLVAVQAVPHLVVGQQVQGALLGDVHEVLGDEHVNLLQGIVHAVQLGRVDEVVEVGRGHATEKVPFTEFDDWRDLQVGCCGNDIKDVIAIQGGGGGVDDLQCLFQPLGRDAFQFYLLLVALTHTAGEHGAEVVRAGCQDHPMSSKTIACRQTQEISLSAEKRTQHTPTLWCLMAFAPLVFSF